MTADPPRIAWEDIPEPRRLRSDRKLPPPNELRRLYWDEEWTTPDIARHFGVAVSSVTSRMRRDGIAQRTRSEVRQLSARKGQLGVVAETTAPLKPALRCKHCDWTWDRVRQREVEACPQCGNPVDARIRYTAATPERLEGLRRMQGTRLERDRLRRQADRRSILLRVGRGVVACVRCGCDRPELLEINHRFGGGVREIRAISGRRFYQSIRTHERTIDDLELCCKICNAWHYLELKHGPLPFTVTWGTSAEATGE